jgi:threonine dehydrogenase-like Zn-dependent dehydrogenase
MGSAAEFKAMCEFLTEKKIPLAGLVDSIFKGLDSADEAFDKMKNGHQLGNFRQTIKGANLPR